jgi:catechol 2,3-dioxygenase-like lactoylglutathione lyase family enzyme
VNALPTLRIARPVADLARAERQYTAGLGLKALSRFEGHTGFSGVILGWPGAPWHLEFTACAEHPVRPQTTVEDLLVFYLPDEADWQARCTAMRAAGFGEEAPFNPWWADRGVSFVCADGYRTVVRHGRWPAAAARGET